MAVPIFPSNKDLYEKIFGLHREDDTPVTESEREEYDALAEIHKHGNNDILGDQLVERYERLCKRYSLFGMIRRIVPNTIANEIVGVQPMTGPTGTIFSVRAKYV